MAFTTLPLSQAQNVKEAERGWGKSCSRAELAGSGDGVCSGTLVGAGSGDALHVSTRKWEGRYVKRSVLSPNKNRAWFMGSECTFLA